MTTPKKAAGPVPVLADDEGEVAETSGKGLPLPTWPKPQSHKAKEDPESPGFLTNGLPVLGEQPFDPVVIRREKAARARRSEEERFAIHHGTAEKDPENPGYLTNGLPILGDSPEEIRRKELKRR
jgi:hypothetical protein